MLCSLSHLSWSLHPQIILTLLYFLLIHNIYPFHTLDTTILYLLWCKNIYFSLYVRHHFLTEQILRQNLTVVIIQVNIRINETLITFNQFDPTGYLNDRDGYIMLFSNDGELCMVWNAPLEDIISLLNWTNFAPELGGCDYPS